MDIKAQLEQDLKNAMRSGNVIEKNTIRMALTNLKMAEVERGGQIDSAAQLALIQKEIKMRQETLEVSEKEGREDLAAKAREEMAVLSRYLPRQLSEDELKAVVAQTIEEVGAAGPADIGKVMKAAMGKVQGQAPGDAVSRIARELLQNRK
ncbi:MAG TPA: GatB/YqeY domain-containing protein [Chloroflexi bacterium]|nr:GatB/YqeY domain-containing protein [Chloroflexota bacterium]